MCVISSGGADGILRVSAVASVGQRVCAVDRLQQQDKFARSVSYKIRRGALCNTLQVREGELPGLQYSPLRHREPIHPRLIWLRTAERTCCDFRARCHAHRIKYRKAVQQTEREPEGTEMERIKARTVKEKVSEGNQ